MSYYVSAQDGSKRVLCLGPFDQHGDALAHVDEVREFVGARDPRGKFYAFGTAHVRSGRPHARLAGFIHYVRRSLP